jgi:hypothetical protein
VHVRPYKIIQLVEHAINHLHKQMPFLVLQRG